MIYNKTCERCQKEFQAARPHGRFCSDNCRVGYYSTQKRRQEKISFLENEIQQAKSATLLHETMILELEKSLQEKQAAIKYIRQKQKQLEEELALKYSLFYTKNKNRIDPLTGRRCRN